MNEVERSQEVAAPAAVVWSVLEDVRLLPTFSPSTVEVNAPARLERVGQEFEQVVELAGRRFRSTWTVEAIDPGRCLVITGSVLPGTKYRMTEMIEPLGPDRSRVGLVMAYKLPFGPLGRLAAKLGVETRAVAEVELVLAGVARAAEAQVARRLDVPVPGQPS
ncbi:MAG: SRPBCC family protein [Acidimicrobiia bacterium]|nr:SRPBCC family protein [Acidimicrobiia bacterium]